MAEAATPCAAQAATLCLTGARSSRCSTSSTTAAARGLSWRGGARCGSSYLATSTPRASRRAHVLPTTYYLLPTTYYLLLAMASLLLLTRLTTYCHIHLTTDPWLLTSRPSSRTAASSIISTCSSHTASRWRTTRTPCFSSAQPSCLRAARWRDPSSSRRMWSSCWPHSSIRRRPPTCLRG